MSNAQQTPLVELLDSVPQGAVFVATESNVPFPASTSHPVGRLCHEASERIKELEAQLETARMRLIACDVVALADTPDSAAKARAMHHDYRSHALEYVERRVDECIALRAQVEALRKDAACFKAIEHDFSPMGMDINGNHAWVYRRNLTLKGPTLRDALLKGQG